MPNLENLDLIREIKSQFAPDGGAEREHNATETSLGFGAIHHTLVRNLRPERALVIGSRYGYVPAVIALALQENGKGTLDFVDANYSDAVHGSAIAFGGVGNWECPASRFSDLELDPIVKVYVMRSDTFFGQQSDARYGYVYIDGDHSYEGCRADLMQALASAEEGAIIALHDVLVTDPGFGVGRLFQELESAGHRLILIPVWPGLGLMQVRNSRGE
jgi:predicted O-methyltransferase YrrM